MRILLITISVTILGLLSSCDKKPAAEQNEIKIEERIFDNAHTLNAEQKDSIFQIIKTLDNEIGSQIAIITIDTLIGEDINEFSINKVDELRLGRDVYLDGLLVVIAVKNHEARIEVGYGLEKIIRDEIASEILREDMIPRFRENDYSGGLRFGIQRIKKLIEDNKQLVGQRIEP